jgi:hypothetical protein
MTHTISEQFKELVGRVELLETQNKFMRQALRDIRDHDEDESWTYEILQFVASETLRLNAELGGNPFETTDEGLEKLIKSKRF